MESAVYMIRPTSINRILLNSDYHQNTAVHANAVTVKKKLKVSQIHKFTQIFGLSIDATCSKWVTIQGCRWDCQFLISRDRDIKIFHTLGLTEAPMMMKICTSDWWNSTSSCSSFLSCPNTSERERGRVLILSAKRSGKD